jgi:phosphomannomutase
VTRSFVTLLRRRETPASVAVARDGRPGGRELAATVTAVAAETGFDVVDLGEVSTPTAKLAARLAGLGGAVVVTASHLGPDWNGLKFVAAPDYLPVDVRNLLLLPEASRTAEHGRVIVDGRAVEAHADAICAAVDVELIRSAALRVSVGGGVGTLGETLLERLGCTAAGTPVDLGLLLDPDGDRLRLVDEHGKVLDPELVLPLVAEATAATAVVRGADTSRMVDELVAARGGSVTVVPPGELHLVEELIRTRADLAGEGNGGVLVPAVGRARDGLAAAALVVEHVARVRRPLSDLAAALPRLARRRWTIPCGSAERAQAVLDGLAARLGVQGPDDPEVGITVEAGGAWALVRRSATEHVVRVTVEGRDASAADALRSEIRRALHPQRRPA